MIHIQFTSCKDGKCLMLKAEGHAEQNEYGKDIVCSATSILIYTLAQNVEDMHEKYKLMEKPVIDLTPGNAFVKCIPVKSDFTEISNLFLYVQRGFELLSGSYPQYVQLKKFDEDK